MAESLQVLVGASPFRRNADVVALGYWFAAGRRKEEFALIVPPGDTQTGTIHCANVQYGSEASLAASPHGILAVLPPETGDRFSK